MTELLAFRAPDDLVQEIKDRATQSGKSRTDVIIEAIKIGLGLPATPLSPIEERLAVIEDRVLAIAKLETQMSEVVNRLDEIDRPKTNSLDTGSELEASDRKISPESSRDSSEAGTSTSEKLVAIDPDVCRAIIAVLRPHSDSGYYFRSEYLGQTKISHNYRQQAIKMGFSSESTRIDGKQIRVWWNRDYCITSV